MSKRMQFSDPTNSESDPETTAMLAPQAANGGGSDDRDNDNAKVYRGGEDMKEDGGGGDDEHDDDDDHDDDDEKDSRAANGGGRRGINAVESWRHHATAFDRDSDDDSDDDGMQDRFELYDDIYSMLFLCHLFSSAALFSIFTFALKMMFFTFLILDLLTGNPDENPFGAPAGVSNLVRTAQFFMLPVAVAMQEDLIGSIFLVNVHYDSNVLRKAPGATYWKWVFSSGLRLIDGMYSLTVNFCLLLTSSEVLGLFLNFAALAFLQTIDNVAFHLALHGYLNDAIEEVAHRTTKVTLPRYARGIWAVMDSIMFIAIFVAIAAVWVVVTVKQIRGDYLCQSLGVDFSSDMFGPAGSDYSGEYNKVNTLTIALRAVYELNRVESSPGASRGIFAYCSERDYWSFILTQKNPYSLTSEDACRYIFRSPEVSDSYDITEIPPSDWFYRDKRLAGNDEQADGFNIWCNVCKTESDCSDNGQCVNHQCLCASGYYGLNCQYGGPIEGAWFGIGDGGGGGGIGGAGSEVLGGSGGDGGAKSLVVSLDWDHQRDPHVGVDGEMEQEQEQGEEGGGGGGKARWRRRIDMFGNAFAMGMEEDAREEVAVEKMESEEAEETAKVTEKESEGLTDFDEWLDSGKRSLRASQHYFP